MAESSITSWKDRFLSLRKRHHTHIARAGESAMMVGQSIISGAAALSLGVIDQKMAPAEPAYANLGMAKVGPVPVSLAVGALGLGAAIWGHGEKWAPFAEAAGGGGVAAYSYAQGRRMTIDWMAGKK